MSKTSEVKLGPCPFCGCQMEYMAGEEDGPYWRHPAIEPPCWLETAWVSRSLDGEGGINEWNRRAAPTPPAAEAPGQEPVGEVVGDGVFWSKATTKNWLPAGTKLYAAPPTYADAAAKLDAEADRLNALGETKHHEARLNDFAKAADMRDAARFLRSLASPAPKGET